MRCDLKKNKFTSCPIRDCLSLTTPHGAMPITTTLFLDFGKYSRKISPICLTTPVSVPAVMSQRVEVLATLIRPR